MKPEPRKLPATKPKSLDGGDTIDLRKLLPALQVVRDGDFTVRLSGDWTGLGGKIADTFNEVVSANARMARELQRIGDVVGKRGKTRQRVSCENRGGAWGGIEDSVNTLIDDLLWPTAEVTRAIGAVAKGDLSQTMRLEVDGLPLEGEFLRSATIVNTMIEQMSAFTSEVTRVAREVGTDGKLGGQAQVSNLSGAWKDLTDNVNSMASNLTAQVRNISEVTIAVASGDLSRKITVDVRGEILQLKEAMNTMVDQLRSFGSEVTRVAREVGTDGKLGGQAIVPGVAGTWKDLTDSVNAMASNLTSQVRNIAEVTTAVARGDLSRKITVDVKGEILELKDTINTLVDQLNGFAAEVTRVAREVGVEGRLGGQANVPGAAGTWKDLTANVNLLAANLTTQVRAIAEVATAVKKGDLTRSIQVDVRGEVADLKDNINAMIGNLRATTERNTEQDWLKTNLTNFSRMMQGQRDLITVGHRLLSELAPLIEAQQGVMYVMETDPAGGEPYLTQLATYADVSEYGTPRRYRIGEGVVGQCAKERQRILLVNTPSDSIQITSGLMSSPPRTVIVLPVLFEGQVKAVIELASLNMFTPSHLAFLEQLTGSIGIVFNTIEATMRTEGLLKSSRQLAGELQAQAAELALTSRSKSEFLADMSHELRTPLNSILILGQQLADNADKNLSERQVEFAKTIHSAGTDLLNRIQDILDLSKIESGTVTVEVEELPFHVLRESIERNFKHEAERRKLEFTTEFAPELGRAIATDPKRLLQVVKNLLSNAFKFTERGSVRLDVSVATDGWTPDHRVLEAAPTVVAFAVSDTGIGISPDKQRIVFEAFQQADAGTARKYGGTGLGLAISRELAGLLGGEIRLQSTVGEGSTFTLYLPLTYQGPASGTVKYHAAAGAESMQLNPVVLPAPSTEQVEDDRHDLQPADAVFLIVEDDPHYARMLLQLARTRGFKGLVAMTGANALTLAREFRPAAISLDIFLPDMLGWTVLSRLKQDHSLRHIPVQIVTLEEQRNHGLERGAFGYLSKPVTTDGLEAAFEHIKDFTMPRRRELLIVEDDAVEQMSLLELLGHDDVNVSTAGTGAQALELLHVQHPDCVVLDLRLPDITGFELLEEIQEDPSLSDVPVVVFTGKELTEEEELQLRAMAKSVVLKGVHSPERLLDETALFLHRVIADLPLAKQRMLERLHQTDEALMGKKVLVVDDDVRNIFALSTVLERRSMRVLNASTGQEAIDLVQENPDIALILMDIMMPEMDGYETMRRMRQDSRFRLLPIIALTAKAMQGDRERCLEAGASDYIAKPVDTEHLLSLLRMWLHR